MTVVVDVDWHYLSPMRSTTHASTSPFLSTSPSSLEVTALKSPAIILPLHPGSRRTLTSISSARHGSVAHGLSESKSTLMRRKTGDDVHIKRIPPVTRNSSRVSRGKHKLFPCLDPIAFLLRIQAGSKAFPRQKRHGRKGHVLKRRLVLGVSPQEGSAHSRIVQERVPDVSRDFLEEDDIRRFWSLEDMAEDEFGA